MRHNVKHMIDGKQKKLLSHCQKWKDASNYWRLVFRRIFHVTLTLTTNQSAFHTHRNENEQKIAKRSLVELIHLLSRFDLLLKELLDRPKGAMNYLSPHKFRTSYYIFLEMKSFSNQSRIRRCCVSIINTSFIKKIFR